MPSCPACAKETLEIDVRCTHCGAALGATGAHRMIGKVMLGQYELVDVLGQGGMSVVFKGRHKMTDQAVALKILPPELAAHSQVKSRFLDEAKALAALDHPNIVHLYNFGQEEGFFVLAMQFVEGKTWERMILENTRLDWRLSCRICVDVLRALEYAHGRGVVHRDMKPSNVLVRAHDGSATVMDFGIAKMTTSTRLTATGQTMGTVRYMSPEQVRGHEVDLRTDIYSLGATLYESLVGDTPFDGTTHFEIMTKHLSDPARRPSVLGVEVPPAVEDALMRSLAKRADDRFESAREMRKILEIALREADVGLVDTQKLDRGLLPELRKPAPAPRLATASDLADEAEPSRRPRAKSTRMPLFVVGALAVIGGGIVVGVLVTRDRSPDAPAELIPGVKLAPSLLIGTQIVTTDGSVTADEVGKRYLEQLDALREHVATTRAKQGAQPVTLTDPVAELFALPQAALCEPRAYISGAAPPDCATAAFSVSYGPHKQQRLYVVATRLDEGLRRGVGNALCVFHPDAATQKQVCGTISAYLDPRPK
ncbi:MAG: serine/threonine-protein kinase [Kofleriaceae bacterium]